MSEVQREQFVEQARALAADTDTRMTRMQLQGRIVGVLLTVSSVWAVSVPRSRGSGPRRRGSGRHGRAAWASKSDCLLGLHHPLDGQHGFGDLLVGLVVARGERALHAVVEVVLQQGEAEVFQGGVDRRDLGEDVNAVLVLIHHPVNAAHLSLDALEAGEVAGLLIKVAVLARVFLHAVILTDLYQGGEKRGVRSRFAIATGDELDWIKSLAPIV